MLNHGDNGGSAPLTSRLGQRLFVSQVIRSEVWLADWFVVMERK